MERATILSQTTGISRACFQGPKRTTLWLAASVATLIMLYWDSLVYLFSIWTTDENFGHGIFVPLISGYLIWQKREMLFEREPQRTWVGFGIVLIGILLYLAGEFSTIYLLLHLSFWLVLCGMAVALLGWKGVRPIVFPLLFLLTMIPLPQFFLQAISAKLQLISSWLGVECLKLVGVMVFRDGNVIDLGPIQLQVAEACSGLRALFPLMTLALICAYFLKGPLWKRAFLFLSSIPIAILLNGLRIGVVGILVEEFGIGAAEGFYHFFEGWVLFLVSLAILVGVMWLLKRVGTDQAESPLIDISEHSNASSQLSLLPIPPRRKGSISVSAAYVCSLFVLTPVLLASTHVSDRPETVPPRQPFLDFPMDIEGWKGQAYPMGQEYINALRFDDYLLADYRQGVEPPVNLYLAYYQSQKKGQSVHSPRTCIPGGGWEIESIRPVTLDLDDSGQSLLQANRVMIQKGNLKQLVYYWFLQRGRNLTNEYLVKSFLFWDSLTRNRSDGALIRLTVPVSSIGEEFPEEETLRAFVKVVHPLLPTFIPD